MQPTVRRRNQQKQQSLNKYGNFLVVFMRVLDWLIWFAGVIFIYLVIAGIQYMTAGAIPNRRKKASRDQCGIIGIVIVVLSLAIVRSSPIWQEMPEHNTKYPLDWQPSSSGACEGSRNDLIVTFADSSA